MSDIFPNTALSGKIKKSRQGNILSFNVKWVKVHTFIVGQPNLVHGYQSKLSHRGWKGNSLVPCCVSLANSMARWPTTLIWFRSAPQTFPVTSPVRMTGEIKSVFCFILRTANFCTHVLFVLRLLENNLIQLCNHHHISHHQSLAPCIADNYL